MAALLNIFPGLLLSLRTQTGRASMTSRTSLQYVYFKAISLYVASLTSLFVHRQDSNRVQQYFSAEKRPSIWRGLPVLESLQTSWEGKREDPRFSLYDGALQEGLEKLGKYYSRLDKKPIYVLSLGTSIFPLPDTVAYELTVLHPYYKMTYIDTYWGGEEEQAAEKAAGNCHAKNWRDEARKILERTVRLSSSLFTSTTYFLSDGRILENPSNKGSAPCYHFHPACFRTYYERVRIRV